MNKSQILLSLGSLALAVFLFQLPKSVVENEQLQEVAPEPTQHTFQIPGDVRGRMSDLRSLITGENNLDKKINFAHSLASYYLDYGLLDSAMYVGELIELWDESPRKEVADIYFKAFERSQNQSDARENSVEARRVIEALLENDPTDLVLKNKLAMTLVTTENPMAGIGLLREILVTDENNRQAILNLGLLAIQSGQFARAKERFEKLISLDPSDHEAKLYLAVSMIEIQEEAKAKLLLEEILSSNDSIPAIKVMANDYLNGL